MSVAAWIWGTNSFVSRRRWFVWASVQKSEDPVARIARVTFTSPALYAAWASAHEPNWF